MSTMEDFQRERTAFLQGFAANVRRLRSECKDGSLSQAELYEKANLHRTEIGRIEQAETEPRLLTLAILADALGASLDDLVAGLPVPKERRPPHGQQRRRS